MDPRPSSVLEQAEALKNAFSRRTTEQKLQLLSILESSSQSGARAVTRLHELLCYWRAYPDSAEVLQQVSRMLERFQHRADLRRNRRQLRDTGIAGTSLDFRFYWLTAQWLRRKGWDAELAIDWPEFGNKSKLVEILHLLMPYSETIALDAHAFSPRRWIEELKGRGETDAAFLIRRFESMGNPASREYLYETLDVPMRLELGEDTTARGRERWEGAPVVFQTRAPVRTRPSLRRVINDTEFEVRALSRARGQELIDLANGAMVTRHRDLLIFLYADPRDVRLVDFGDGLQFACMGARPERRLMLESVYGFLTLRNGVPIGYVLCSALFGSSEVAYNVFPTFRSAEAARIYGCVLAMVHRLFGSDSFTIDPYQLGYGNREGLQSGAWWFYYKMGFRPDDPETRALARKETKKLRAQRSYRTGVDTLNRLASRNLFFSLGRHREDTLGRVSLGEIGLRVTGYLAERHGAARESGLRSCAREAAERLGVRRRRLSGGELLAWKRWAPLVMALPGIERWSQENKTALFEVIRAKGGRRETDFVRRFDSHRALRRAMLKLAQED